MVSKVVDRPSDSVFPLFDTERAVLCTKTSSASLAPPSSPN